MSMATFGDDYTEGVNQVLQAANKRLEQQDAEGTWDIHDPHMAPDFLLSCPCDQVIELDGRCPSGHVSPLLMAGLV